MLAFSSPPGPTGHRLGVSANCNANGALRNAQGGRTPSARSYLPHACRVQPGAKPLRPCNQAARNLHAFGCEALEFLCDRHAEFVRFGAFIGLGAEQGGVGE